MDNLFQTAIRQRFIPCHKCSRLCPLKYTIAHYAPPSIRAKRGLHIYCYNCEVGSYESLGGLALNLPEGRAFFQSHPRIHELPQREIEHAGQSALVVSFTDVANNAIYEVILQRKTYETLAIYISDD